MGLVMLAWGVASTLGPLLAGGLSDRWSARAVYAGMILFCALVGIALLRTSRRTARLDAPAVLS
jgi:predicted MFS family arabinose efflux permease